MAEYILKISATNYAAAVQFEYFYHFRYKKELNRISEFRATVYSLTGTQKALMSEGNLFYLFYGTDLILKGEIRNIDRNDIDEEWTIEGNGMEIKLHDLALRGRSQWDDTAADTIVKSLLTGTGISEGTIDSAIKVGFRAEEDSILRSVMKLASAIGYDWYVDQDGTYDVDRLNFVAQQGSTEITENFNTYNAIDIFDHDGVDDVFNVVRALGYGDGINQLISESFAATANRATLSAEISATATSLTVNEAIDNFPATGDLRCGREWIKYSSKDNGTKTFSGLTRGYIPATNPPADNPYYIKAYAHKKGAEIIDLQHSNGGFPSKDDAQAGSSIATYGLRENIYAEQSIMHQSTVDLLAQRLVNKYEIPIRRVEFTAAQESLTADIGDYVRIQFLEELYPSNTLYPSAALYPGHLAAKMRLIAYEFDDDAYTMKMVLGGPTEDVLEDISQLQKNLDINSVYGLGNTCIFSVQSYENCDSSYPLHLRFFLPEELLAINHVFLSFKIKDYRAYTGTTPAGGGHSTPAGGGHTTPAGGGGTSSATSGYWGAILNDWTNSYAGGQTHTHNVINGVTDGPSYTVAVTRINDFSSGDFTKKEHQHTIYDHQHTVNDHQHTVSNHTHAMTYAIYPQTGSTPSITVKVGEDGETLTEVSGSPFDSDKTKLDITSLVQAVGVNKWIDVEFTPNQVQRIEANLHCQVFIESK